MHASYPGILSAAPCSAKLVESKLQLVRRSRSLLGNSNRFAEKLSNNCEKPEKQLHRSLAGAETRRMVCGTRTGAWKYCSPVFARPVRQENHPPAAEIFKAGRRVR